MNPLTEADIAARLQAAYRPGDVAYTDGYAGLHNQAKLKCAAVLMPLLRFDDEWHLLFTRRTETVEYHRGQVSFPGGGCDRNETTPEQTALREAEEEIGLKPGDVRLLGRLNMVLTISRYWVTPVVGVIPWPCVFSLSPHEVEKVFTIPLAWLRRGENWDENPFTPEGGRRSFPVIIYHPYDSEVLWGASARMTHIFLGVLGLLNK